MAKKRKAAAARETRCVPTENDPEFYGIRLLDRSHREKFTTLAGRIIEPTRFVDLAPLEAMGIWENLQLMFTSIGWAGILGTAENTYRRVVLEILSTLEFDSRDRSSPSSMSFQLNNKRWTLTVREINQLFGCVELGHFKYGSEFCATEFWAHIALEEDQPFSSGTSKAPMIRNPVFRMAHRIIAHTVLSQKDNTSVRDVELFMFRGMVTETKMNMGQFLMSQLKRVSNAKRGPICIGGMLTPLARHLCPEILQWEIVPGDTRLSVKRLLSMRILDGVAPPFALKQDKGDDFPLPNPHLTAVSTLQDTQNWLMNTETHRMASAAYEAPPNAEDEYHESPHLRRRTMKVTTRTMATGTVVIQPRRISSDEWRFVSESGTHS